MPLRSYLVFCCAFIASSCTFALARDSAANDIAITPYDRLASMDFAALKAALEKAGWPASHVQAVVILEIQRRLNPIEPPKAADFAPFVFWHTGPDAEPLAPLNTPERRAERSRRAGAARDQIEALVPSEEPGDQKLLRAWEAQRQWGDLPAAKRTAVTELLSRAEKERDAYLQAHRDVLTPEDDRVLDRLAKQARAELGKILNPDELLDYDLRNSETAARMRSELDAFQPTREEFLAIFGLRHPLELEFAHLAPGHNPDLDRRRTAAEAEVDQALVKLLGPERYDDYRISLEPACQMLRFDGRTAHASAASVRQLYRKLIAAQAALHGVESFSEARRKPVETKIKTELYHDFAAVLGESGARHYLEEQSIVL